MSRNPLPENEEQRVAMLAEYDLDYADLQASFKGLAELAAKIAGTSVSLVNLIDAYTQWTICSHGIFLEQMPRDESVCQYTILENECFEVKNLSTDDRFKNKYYVSGSPYLNYYFGIPLPSGKGVNMGSLCVMDSQSRTLNDLQVRQLQLIANEIVERLKTYRAMTRLRKTERETKECYKKLARELRDTLSRISSCSADALNDAESDKGDVLITLVRFIEKESRNMTRYVRQELLDRDHPLRQTTILKNDEFNQLVLKEKLEKLYCPQAQSRGLSFEILTDVYTQEVAFSKILLLQLFGNLVSWSLQAAGPGDKMVMSLKLQPTKSGSELHAEVRFKANTETRESSTVCISLASDLIQTLQGKMERRMKDGYIEVNVCIPQYQK